MSPSNITAIFIITIIVIIAGYDLYILIRYGKYATISDVIRRLGTYWPMLMPLLAFAMGLLYGHLFLCG